MHGAASGSIQLTAANASALGLVDGGMYSIDLFQAERHTCASTYKLTLSGQKALDARKQEWTSFTFPIAPPWIMLTTARWTSCE